MKYTNFHLLTTLTTQQRKLTKLKIHFRCSCHATLPLFQTARQALQRRDEANSMGSVRKIHGDLGTRA